MSQQRPSVGTKRFKRWSRGSKLRHLPSRAKRHFGWGSKTETRRQRRRVEERAWRREQGG